MGKKMKYKLILTSNHIKLEHISASRKKETIYRSLSKKLKESKTVRFPIKYLNKGKTIIESDYELLVLKKKEKEDDVSLLRDKLGKFVEQIIVDNDEWLIIDKRPYNIEETFWVYGFHPTYQRKTFQEILNMFILSNTYKKYLKMIMVYKNKLIIKNEDMFEMVICKCVDDAVRLYNQIEKYCNNNKIRNLVYRGLVNRHNYPQIVNYIMNETGWAWKKVIRSSTRP